MKNIKIVFLFILSILSIEVLNAQCIKTSCNGSINSGTYSSAIGNQTKSTANYSFASGNLSEASGESSTAFGISAKAIGKCSFSLGNSSSATGENSIALGYNAVTISDHSFAIGYWSKADGLQSFAIGQNAFAKSQAYAFGNYALANCNQSMAIGKYVETQSSGAIAIGWSTNGYNLVNNKPYSLMVGFNSNVPTFYVGTSPTTSSAGKVGIGTSSPSTNLHILSNTGENALLYVQTKQFTGTAYAGFLLGNQSHGVTADPTNGLMFRTQKYYIFNDGNVGIGTSTPLTKLQVTGTSMFDKVGIGTSNPLADLQVNGSVSIGYESALPTQAKSLIVSGLVGIGTFTPTAKLDVVGKIKAVNLQLTTGFNTGYLLVSDNQGNASWVDPTTINAGAWIRNGNNIYVGTDKKIGIGTETPAEQLQIVGNLHLSGAIKGGHTDWHPLAFYGGTSETDGSYILMGNNSTGSDGSIKMFAKGTNSGIEFSNKNMTVMNIKSTNEIVIGSPDTKANMFVNGEINANLVRVNTQEWYDCVFDTEYKLQPLSEIEAYINQHKHLPEIPSEAEVKADGIDVAQMNALLLKKVEELTLYVIALEKRVNEISK
jgi:hypothetical protein